MTDLPAPRGEPAERTPRDREELGWIKVWYLDGLAGVGVEKWRTPVRRFPFRVGRQVDLDMVLPFHRISKQHAMFFQRGGGLWLRDLRSTNGTFVNGRRLQSDAEVSDGDLIHFADREFRLIASSQPRSSQATQEISPEELARSLEVVAQARNFHELLASERLKAIFQPLVRLDNHGILGYELLGRGQLESAEALPEELFMLAETLGLEAELSRAFRVRGMEDAELLPGDPALFFNTHPAELGSGGDLLESLGQLRSHFPSRRLVLEIHEAALTDVITLKELSTSLQALDIGVAFDDFGTGQARLLELIDIAPQYVKFDRTWIRDLHRASGRRRDLVSTLVRMVTDMGVATVAEGIEVEAEAEACRAMGFEFAQGYLFGRPAPAAVFA